MIFNKPKINNMNLTQKFKIWFAINLALFLTIGAIAQSPVTSTSAKNTGQTDFCTALQQIVADYPNGFENIKAEKHTGERSWDNYYTSKVNPEGVLLGKISGKTYEGFFARGTEDYNEAKRIFAKLQRNLESCQLPFRIQKTRETEDGIDRKITYRPVGAEAAYSNLQIEIGMDDLWIAGIDVKISVKQAR
jgi:hypothetical protein